MFANSARLFMLTLLGLAISACSGTVQDRFGLGKRAPDEFQVVRRAPLVIPPDFKLRPPGDDNNTPVTRDPTAQAREIVTGQPETDPKQPSPVELAVLEQSPVEAMPKVRERILEESNALVQLDEGRFLFILDFQRSDLQAAPVVVNPVEESERLIDAGVPTRVTTRRLGTETFVTRPGLPDEVDQSAGSTES